jgi:hypothetical protein
MLPCKAPNNLADYAHRPSKQTGEIDCVHLDWRIRGHAALCRAGFVSVRDVLDINHRAFWAHRLIMLDIDPDRLGRAYHNWWHQTRGRTAAFTSHCLPSKKRDFHLRFHASVLPGSVHL